MARLFMGMKPGVGPVLKVMANNDDDPLTTPNTGYGKFRFNSETANLAYIPVTLEIARDLVNFPGLSSGSGSVQYFWPVGSNASNCLAIVDTYRSSGGSKWQYWNILWGRFGLDYPPLVESLPTAFPADVGDRRYYDFGDTPGGYFISYADRNALAVGFVNAGSQMVYPRSSFGALIVSTSYGGFYSTVEFGTSSTLPPQVVSAWALPMDDTPLTAIGTPSAGQKVLRLSPTVARLAKPGYDVETATGDQLIFSEERSPAAILRTGEVTIAAGANVTIDTDYPITSRTRLNAIVVQGGEDYKYWPATQGSVRWNNRISLPISYTVSGDAIVITNEASQTVTVRYIVYAEDGLPPTTGGGGKVLAVNDSYAEIRRPGSSASPVFNDILLDTRWAHLPLVAEGWLPLSAFASVSNDNERNALGTQKASVSWANDGSWVPFIKFGVQNRAETSFPGRPMWWSSPVAREVSPNQFTRSPNTGESRNTFQSRNSTVCRYTDTTADFYMSPDSSGQDYRYESNGVSLAWRNSDPSILTRPNGIRYYVFAIPNAL